MRGLLSVPAPRHCPAPRGGGSIAAETVALGQAVAGASFAPPIAASSRLRRPIRRRGPVRGLNGLLAAPDLLRLCAPTGVLSAWPCVHGDRGPPSLAQNRLIRQGAHQVFAGTCRLPCSPHDVIGGGMFRRFPQCSWNSSSARRKPAASSARASSAILFLSERTEHASDVPKSMTGASSGSHVRERSRVGIDHAGKRASDFEERRLEVLEVTDTRRWVQLA